MLVSDLMGIGTTGLHLLTHATCPLKAVLDTTSQGLNQVNISVVFGILLNPEFGQMAGWRSPFSVFPRSALLFDLTLFFDLIGQDTAFL